MEEKKSISSNLNHFFTQWKKIEYIVFETEIYHQQYSEKSFTTALEKYFQDNQEAAQHLSDFCTLEKELESSEKTNKTSLENFKKSLTYLIGNVQTLAFTYPIPAIAKYMNHFGDIDKKTKNLLKEQSESQNTLAEHLFKIEFSNGALLQLLKDIKTDTLASNDEDYLTLKEIIKELVQDNSIVRKKANSLPNSPFLEKHKPKKAIKEFKFDKVFMNLSDESSSESDNDEKELTKDITNKLGIDETLTKKIWFSQKHNSYEEEEEEEGESLLKYCAKKMKVKPGLIQNVFGDLDINKIELETIKEQAITTKELNDLKDIQPANKQPRLKESSNFKNLSIKINGDSEKKNYDEIIKVNTMLINMNSKFNDSDDE